MEKEGFARGVREQIGLRLHQGDLQAVCAGVNSIAFCLFHATQRNFILLIRVRIKLNVMELLPNPVHVRAERV